MPLLTPRTRKWQPKFSLILWAWKQRNTDWATQRFLYFVVASLFWVVVVELWGLLSLMTFWKVFRSIRCLLTFHFRYGVLNVQGVRDAITSVPIDRPNDKEKQDRTVAKVILDKLGFDKEKYRLGYTKVFYYFWNECSSFLSWLIFQSLDCLINF